MELVKIKRKYKSKTGEEKIGTNFYLLLENGNMVSVNPVVYKKKGEEFNNFKELSLIAREITPKE